MKKICIVTATRAEYGLLRPLILGLEKEEFCDIKIAVTGAHLSTEFGLTYKEILEDDLLIDEKIEMLISSDTPSSISKSMALSLVGFADYFKNNKFDLIIILGDRYEMLTVAICAMNERIPIAHLHGGESTEGLIDEAIRHSITKMSQLHFASTETYRNRIIQLGENPNRVFNVGSLGVHNIKSIELMTKKALEKAINWELTSKYAIVTLHPVTLEGKKSMHYMKELLKALSKNKEFQYIFTKGNSDAYGRSINHMIDEYVDKNDNCIAFSSMGLKKYLSAVKYASFVIGNSSSGIIEVPSFKIPTINIGDRQKGRIQSKSVINCLPLHHEINKAIQLANSKDFKSKIIDCINPYEKENTVKIIIGILKKELLSEKSIVLKKKFYDLFDNGVE